MVKGTDLKPAPACCRRGTPYKVSLRDVFSLDSRLRGNDEGLRGMTEKEYGVRRSMGSGRTMYRDRWGQSKITPDSAIGHNNEDFTLTPGLLDFRGRTPAYNMRGHALSPSPASVSTSVYDAPSRDSAHLRYQATRPAASRP